MTPAEQLRDIAAVRIQAHRNVLSPSEIADLIYIDLTALGYQVIERAERQRRRPMDNVIELVRCESCGARATVTLDDGSHWCESCDVAARCFEAMDRAEQEATDVAASTPTQPDDPIGAEKNPATGLGT